MKTSFWKRQSTWICILIVGLGLITAWTIHSKFTVKAESYLPLLKYSANTDTSTIFNLGFEAINPAGSADGWFRWGMPSYNIQLDSVVKHSGKYALRIESKNQEAVQGFGCPARSIPAVYAGERITVKAFMKTEGVDQPIGLLLRIDGKSGGLEFDNMTKKNVTETNGWQEYSVTLPLPESAETIFIGAILSGKGKLWIDDFQLLIDGRDLAEAKPKVKKEYKAATDTEFNKGSQINIKDYTPQTVTNLEVLGRIWGFLKYYHPAIASGDHNWDAELFRVMPAVVNAQTIEERNKILVQWIDRLGKVKTAKKQEKDTMEVKLLPNLEWIDKPELGKELSRRLTRIKKAARNTEHYYIRLYSNVGNPVFKNEKIYSQMNYNADSGMCLLALFRYWNMIEYFFPYKHLMDKDWDIVLHEFIPVFLDVFTELQYQQALLQLVAHVNDTHATIGNNNVLFNWKGTKIAPYHVSFIEGKAVVTGIVNEELAESTGLKIGDIIVSVDQNPVDKFVEERLPYTPASNTSVQLRNISNELLRTNAEKLSLQIIRNGKPQACEVTCLPFRKIYEYLVPKASHRLLTSDIGYIWPETLKNDSLPAIMEKFKDTKGIVIDFRCYPRADFTVFTLGAYLTPEPTEFVKFTNGNIAQPGKFAFTKSLSVGDNNNPYDYKGKVVIIVNEQTQSSAEYHTMAFQTAPGAKVIGSTTAAADGNVSRIVLPGNVNTMITGIGVYYPDGRETQRVGIALDMEVKPTIRGIIEGRDELLEKAIEIINEPN